MAAQKWISAAAMEIDPAKNYVATIETTRGNIIVELYPTYAPKLSITSPFWPARASTTALPPINNFMVQAATRPALARRPWLSLRRRGARQPAEARDWCDLDGQCRANNLNGSQFFITHSPQPHLNGKHTVSGKVIEGQDVVNAVRQGDLMNKVTVAEK